MGPQVAWAAEGQDRGGIETTGFGSGRRLWGRPAPFETGPMNLGSNLGPTANSLQATIAPQKEGF